MAAFWPLDSRLGCVAFDHASGCDGLIYRGAWPVCGRRSDPLSAPCRNQGAKG